PELDILWRVTAKYGLPYFANFVHSDMSPDDARSMCCRLRIDNRELLRKGGGLFGASPLTGSIGVVTINMPRLGRVAKDERDFLERLAGWMELSKQSLEVKRKVIEQFTEQNLYPYMKFYLRNVAKRFGAYWKNHFATIGIIGMHEACQNLLGEGIAAENGRRFTLRVMDFMRERLLEFQKETGSHYNLEATPAEGVSFRFAQADQQKFGGNGNQAATPMFYTNSTHLPVNYTDDLFEALDLQDDIQAKYTGGTVIHAYVGEEIKETGGLKRLIKKICSQYRLPYFSITPTFSVCPDCGYQAGKQEQCPKCGKVCEVYSRVVGYLRPVRQWNAGKKAEFGERRTYKI
ncbi:MAG: anaerobic ribonucleoside-triphosphate reductase, partial [Desulfobacteraceae bacterium]